MSDDKRKVSTDALETLGNIIGPEEKRDAIHLAVIPMKATHAVGPGADVAADGSPYSRPFVGIVDPFLATVVSPGQWFWLVIYPRQITSLRHVWSHPAFPEETPDTVPAPISKEFSEKWLREWVDKSDQPFAYDQFLKLIERGSLSFDEDYSARVEDDYIYVYGRDAGGEIPEEVWNHLENVLGRKLVTRPGYFSCSC